MFTDSIGILALLISLQPIFIFVLCSLECHCYVSSYSYNSTLQIVDVVGNKIFEPQNRWCWILFWRKDDSICPYLKNFWDPKYWPIIIAFSFYRDIPLLQDVFLFGLYYLRLIEIHLNHFQTFTNLHTQSFGRKIVWIIAWIYHDSLNPIHTWTHPIQHFNNSK